MDITVSVTEEDISRGKQGRNTGCPIDRACRRCTGRDLTTIIDVLKIDIPRWVSQWILDYDEGKQVQPISFNLEF